MLLLKELATNAVSPASAISRMAKASSSMPSP
jgi:hypothetical protein